MPFGKMFYASERHRQGRITAAVPTDREGLPLSLWGRSVGDESTRPGAATEEAEAHDRLQHRYALAEKVEV